MGGRVQPVGIGACADVHPPRKASSRRIEVRSPDSACNPYLAFAVLLAAGLRGIEKNYVLGPQAEDNVWSLTPEERRAMGYRELPSSLGVALAEMEGSELVAEALGGARLRLLPAQQAHRVGELPQHRHPPVRAEELPVAVVASLAPPGNVWACPNPPHRAPPSCPVWAGSGW